MARDPHEVLGVRKNASAKAIKRAYHRLAMELHPDRNPGDEDAARRFAEVADAWAVLSGKADRAKAGQVDDKVHQSLTTLFVSALQSLESQRKEPTEHDVLAVMREFVRKRLVDMEAEKVKLAQALAKFKRMAGRFDVGGDAENVFESVVQRGIGDCEAKVATIDEEMAVVRAVQEYLAKCRWRFEPPKSPWMDKSGLAAKPGELWEMMMGPRGGP